ncbi:MAG: 1-acyl-sn-glycerol-3-phosphate acyltransferase [Lachnoclostridium sp.]|nr:1-acyl-sn-glycerol-3-phosphate acyltransferase [Lachnospira sp.]MCM1247223.1 1-acyl-sn-glycerol-3-phosphate acyltransferase [Lachnoclostridium sp.]
MIQKDWCKTVKIIFDFDGVLTDYNRFIQKNAIPYFQKKYHMAVVRSDALELEDIFDIQNVLENYGYSVQESANISEKILNQFWVSHRFIKFSLLNRFRKGVRAYINNLKRQGILVEIHSSRSKTCESSIVGVIARSFSVWQCWLNGIFLKRNQIFFYADDKEKIAGILKSNPTIVFDDKPQIVEQLAENNLKVICVSSIYNKMVLPSKNVEIVHTFARCEIEEKIGKLLGKANYICHKREIYSANFFNKLVKAKFVFELLFHPIVLHPENIISGKREGIIYAPNHRSTLDPLVVESVLAEHIHWAALVRFFTGEDSIFNNNKTPILCNITRYVFRRLEYFPIERKKDNPNANNLESLKDMNQFLKNGYKIGIFAEGTTQREAGKEFGIFDDAFLRMAKRNRSWIQPITLLWNENSDTKFKVVINFGQPFQVEEMSIEESMKYFMEIQKAALKENQMYEGYFCTDFKKAREKNKFNRMKAKEKKRRQR